MEMQKSDLPLAALSSILKVSGTIIQREPLEFTRTLVDAIHDPLIIVNADGLITDLNDALVKITGIEHDELINTYFIDYFVEPQRTKEIYEELLKKGSISDFPLTLCHKDGRLTEVLCNGLVYKSPHENALGAIIIAKDLTEQKRLASELIEAKNNAGIAIKKAEESSQLKESFLANMSHEIRTPLNAIIGFADILAKKKLGKKENEHVKTIKSAGENLLTIISDILDISKIEAGIMFFEEKSFSIQDIFQSVEDMLAKKAKEKDLDLLFKIDNNVPDMLLGDPIRLTQILINLTGNAIKFTSKGKVQVGCKLLKKEAETSLIEFSVKDTGIGIPEDKLHFVFERFRQAESHTTRKYGGSGLGLSIAKQLVELQGGILSVKSKLKVGSTFSFAIPYKNTSEAQQEIAPMDNKYNMKKLSKLKILLVEDNRLNVLLVQSLFSENNLKLQIAENGSVCIEKLKQTDFDIVLMDMEMPVMNGYEAATIIRRDFKRNIPIIAMTAHAMAGEREKCLSLGMNDYISKPINANLLFEKMYKLTIKLPS